MNHWNEFVVAAAAPAALAAAEVDSLDRNTCDQCPHKLDRHRLHSCPHYYWFQLKVTFFVPGQALACYEKALDCCCTRQYSKTRISELGLAFGEMATWLESVEL